MTTQKLVGLVGLVLLAPALNGATAQMVAELNEAIDNSDKVQVQELLSRTDDPFNAEQIKAAYNRAVTVYEQNNSPLAKTGEVLLNPGRLAGLLMGSFFGYNSLVAREKRVELRTNFPLEKNLNSQKVGELKAKLPGQEAKKKELWKSLSVVWPTSHPNYPAYREAQKQVDQTKADIKHHEDMVQKNKAHYDRENQVLSRKMKMFGAFATVSAVAAIALIICRSTLADARAIMIALDAKMLVK